jgi:excisionase family DNA binding protein
MTYEGLTVREAVERLGVGRASVDRWCRSGKLKAAQRGLRWIVGADAFEAPATERARWIPTPTQRASWVPRHPRSLRSRCRRRTVGRCGRPIRRTS